MMPNNGPMIWQGQKAKMLNSGGLEFKNGVTFNTYLTIAAAKAATPTGPELAYVESVGAVYLYCDSCAFDADDDLVLTTGNGGTTRWEMLQKLSRFMGDTGWIDHDNATLSAISTIAIRLAISSQAAIGIKGSRIPVPIGNYDATISGVPGIKFVGFDDDTLVLKVTDTLWDFNAEVPVSIVYWTGTVIAAAPQTEFHGIRDTVWHHYTHRFIGLQYVSGLAFTVSVQTDNNANPGASETVYNLWSTAGKVQDEDYESSPGSGQWLQTLGSGLAAADAAIIPFFYYNGSFLTTSAAMADRAPFIHAGANTPPQWESAGTLTASVTGDYIVYHYFVTPMVGGWSVFARPHNAKYTSLATALAARPNQLAWSNYAEIKHIYTAIFRVNTGWSNSHRCKLVSLSDYRTVNAGPVAATSPTVHAGLSGLELAASGVTWGHIDGQPQTIAGAKTFTSHPLSTDADVPAGNELIPVAKLGPVIAAAANKSAIVDADKFAVADSANSNALVDHTFANLKAALKTYNDTLYLPLAKSFVDATKGGQSLGNSASTKIVGWTEVTDTLGEFEPTTNGRFTATVAGIYAVDCNVLMDNTTWGVGDFIAIKLYKNGGEFCEFPRSYSQASQTFYLGTQGNLHVTLAATDYLEFYIYLSRGGGNTSTVVCRFTVVRV